MELIKSKNANENYLSKIVNITTFRPHSNAEKLKCCTVDGFNIITSIDAEPGLYVYFSVLSCINSEFLWFANLYKHQELNKDNTKSGMFEDNGRVKAVTLRGELSEGFILPASILNDFVLSKTNQKIDNLKDGVEFDAFSYKDQEFYISKKYVIKSNKIYTKKSTSNRESNIKAGFDRLISDQFRYHYNTILLKKCPYIISPDTQLNISYKLHGTSGISAYVLCNRKLKWYEKLFAFITRKHLNKCKYDYLYASRKVIKNRYGNNIDDTVWAAADKFVRPCLAYGQSAYYEIVGYLPNGKAIQKDYDYGCIPPKYNEEYTPEKHFKVRIYRVTYTDEKGNVVEFNPNMVRHWCHAVDLIPVEECYNGLAKDLYPEIPISEDWNEQFLHKLSNDSNFYMEENSPHCKNKVPHEGLVLKLNNDNSKAYKLKCFRFLSKESKETEVNIEDEN